MYTAQNGRKYTLPTYSEALVVSSMTVPVKIVIQTHLKVNQLVQNVAAQVTYVDVGDVLKWKVYVMYAGHKFYTKEVTRTWRRNVIYAAGNILTFDLDKKARCVMIDQNNKPSHQADKLINIFEIELEGDNQKAVYTCGNDHQWNYGGQTTNGEGTSPCVDYTPIEPECAADQYITSNGNCKEPHDCYNHSRCSSLQNTYQPSGANDPSNCHILEGLCGEELNWTGPSGVEGCCEDYHLCAECLEFEGDFVQCLDMEPACQTNWAWLQVIGFENPF